MNKYNTKQDVYNLLPASKGFVRKLMDERKNWLGGVYQDDPHSSFFQMGFTEAEGLEIVPDYVEPPVPAPPPTPEEIAQRELQAWRESTHCGPLQFRRALRASGLMNAVKQAVNAMTEEDQEAWEYATVFNRLDRLVLGMATQLGKTAVEIDDLFKLALTFK